METHYRLRKAECPGNAVSMNNSNLVVIVLLGALEVDLRRGAYG